VGHTWYAVLTGPGIRADCDFATFAVLTVEAARAEHGPGSAVARAVESAWEQVGVLGGAADSAEGTPGGEVAPVEGTEVLVRRTGGFAGLTRERAVRLAELPCEDADQWAHLLADRRLSAFANGPARPDACCYEVRCDAPPTQVSLPEPRLPAEVRGLLERTLAGTDG
jgi:hypothetical protein